MLGFIKVSADGPHLQNRENKYTHKKSTTSKQTIEKETTPKNDSTKEKSMLLNNLEKKLK